jgi:small basic protein (TIGR04137 family)
MSLHRSLKTKPSALNQHRNVLTRAERITKLKESERFNDGRGPLGLPKVANRLVIAAKKPKKEAAEGEAAAAAAPAPAAPAAKGAAKK